MKRVIPNMSLSNVIIAIFKMNIAGLLTYIGAKIISSYFSSTYFGVGVFLVCYLVLFFIIIYVILLDKIEREKVLTLITKH